jgi:hypothetical protein
MIDKTLTFILGEVNTLLSNRYRSAEDPAVLSSLSNPDGTVPPAIENKIVLSLINVEREAAANGSSWPMRTEGNGFGRVSPPLGMNLLVMVTACFQTNYAEGLKLLSSVVGLFQGKPSFSAQNTAAFPQGMDKLSVEMVNLSLQEINNVWSVLGAKYMPSVAYKIRMLVIQENLLAERVPAITAPSPQVKG